MFTLQCTFITSRTTVAVSQLDLDIAQGDLIFLMEPEEFEAKVEELFSRMLDSND